MNKIYYLKEEVKIGQEIDFKGLKIKITQELIDDNPDLFEVKDLKVLINDVKRRYPKGCRIKCLRGNSYGIVTHIQNPKQGVQNLEDIWIYTDAVGLTLCCYKDGKWAEIEKPIFTTSDGIDIYEEDNYWICPKPCNTMYWNNKYLKEYPKQYNSNFYNSSTSWITFSTKELAEKYITDNTEKTLNDYENILLESKNKFSFGIFNSYMPQSSFYGLLKENEPKLYWTKVLQLIADDLNEGWKPNWESEEYKWAIMYTKRNFAIEYWQIYNAGQVLFKSKELVEKAIKLIEPHLPLIYGI